MIEKRTKPFISRAGSKTCLLAHLLPRFPDGGVKCYVEAFGGGAAVLLARPRTPGTVEVYNDTDAELVNAFRQVREHGEEVGRLLRGRVNSRRDFHRIRAATRDSRTECQRAADWIWLNRLSFGGDGSSFGVKKTPGGGAIAPVLRTEELVTAAQARLQGVIVEELPWERLVKNYDGPGTFFFFDPPYLGATQKHYRGWSLEQVEELAAAAMALRGRWLLTCGDQPGVREKFPGCRITEVDRQSRLRKTGNHDRYAELIIEPPLN